MSEVDFVALVLRFSQGAASGFFVIDNGRTPAGEKFGNQLRQLWVMSH